MYVAMNFIQAKLNPLSTSERALLGDAEFEAVKAAEDKKYVLMNAPTGRLKEIIEVLPGMKSPTVMPLAQEGWSSVHTVLDLEFFQLEGPEFGHRHEVVSGD